MADEDKSHRASPAWIVVSGIHLLLTAGIGDTLISTFPITESAIAVAQTALGGRDNERAGGRTKELLKTYTAHTWFNHSATPGRRDLLR